MADKGTVAVTGGGTGLGLGFVTEFARRGYTVLALCLEESQRAAVEQATADLPGRCTFTVLDVTKPGDFRFPADLSILVNNAGIRLENLPIEDIELDEWRRYFDINFFGLVDMTRRAIPVMRERGGGIICNISSASLFQPIPFLAPYRSTKGAVSAFSESLRTEVKPFNIRVLEFLPSAIRTNMNEKSVTRVIAKAVENPLYARLAKRQREVGEAANVIPIESEEAAVYMIDAIEADYSRMRYGSDAPSTVMMDGWRKKGGEEAIAAFIERLTKPE